MSVSAADAMASLPLSLDLLLLLPRDHVRTYAGAFRSGFCE